VEPALDAKQLSHLTRSDFRVEKYLANNTAIAWSASLSGKERRKCSKLCEAVPLASIDNPSIHNACHQPPINLQIVVLAPTLPQ
jgi:hypothetical protein